MDREGRAAGGDSVVRLMIKHLLAAAALVLTGTGVAAQQPSYLFYVASESDDVVSLLRFSPAEGLEVSKVIPVGVWVAEIEGPHGVLVDPSGEYWYLTLGHGFPFGTFLKYATGSDSLLGHTQLGLFPATIAVPRSGGLAFAVNSNFHGDKVPSTVSVIELESMLEVARIETCTMPHGSRFGPGGRFHYSACMMDNQLVEIDADSLAVSRTLDLRRRDQSGTAINCSPTWVAPSPAGRTVWVACNKGNEIVQVDLASWRVTRRLPAEGAPYNLDITPDGTKLLATLKGKGGVAVWDTESGRMLAVMATERKVTHGVVASPDSRYAFITVEGIGGQPGTVEVMDLDSYRRVASAEVGKQAGGIAFWHVE